MGRVPTPQLAARASATTARPWRQLSLHIGPPAAVEDIAAHHLAPHLTAAEQDGYLLDWFVVRKSPDLRLRYRLTTPLHPGGDRIEAHVQSLSDTGLITAATRGVYEPETHAFGGFEGMRLAHRFFHHDTRHALAYLAAPDGGTSRRREVSLLLCSLMLRAAGCDWYEQGDVWKRVTEHRQPPNTGAAAPTGSVRRLISVDPAPMLAPGGALHHVAAWAACYTTVGADLAAAATSGVLRRGLRAILAHHIIFAWNRIGLNSHTQAALADAAATTVFGPDPSSHTASRALTATPMAPFSGPPHNDTTGVAHTEAGG